MWGHMCHLRHFLASPGKVITHLSITGFKSFSYVNICVKKSTCTDLGLRLAQSCDQADTLVRKFQQLRHCRGSLSWENNCTWQHVPTVPLKASQPYLCQVKGAACFSARRPCSLTSKTTWRSICVLTGRRRSASGMSDFWGNRLSNRVILCLWVFIACLRLQVTRTVLVTQHLSLSLCPHPWRPVASMVRFSPIQSLGLCLAGSILPSAHLGLHSPWAAVEPRLSSFLPALCSSIVESKPLLGSRHLAHTGQWMLALHRDTASIWDLWLKPTDAFGSLP